MTKVVTNIIYFPSTDYVVNLYGMVTISSISVPINYTSTDGYIYTFYRRTYPDIGSIEMKVKGNSYLNCPCFIVFEYRKP